MKINNIKEAQEAIAEVGDFLNRFNLTLGTLGVLSGNANGQAEMGFATRGISMVSAPRIIPRAAPESMPERILDLLRDSPMPLTPKEMVAKYSSLGWPEPANGKIYSTLLASAYYLAKKGRLLNNNGRYSISVTSPTR